MVDPNSTSYGMWDQHWSCLILLWNRAFDSGSPIALLMVSEISTAFWSWSRAFALFMVSEIVDQRWHLCCSFQLFPPLEVAPVGKEHFFRWLLVISNASFQAAFKVALPTWFSEMVMASLPVGLGQLLTLLIFLLCLNERTLVLKNLVYIFWKGFIKKLAI